MKYYVERYNGNFGWDLVYYSVDFDLAAAMLKKLMTYEPEHQYILKCKGEAHE